MVKDANAKKAALVTLIGVMKGADVENMKKFKDRRSKPKTDEDSDDAQPESE
jgi:hypothetical protein